MARRHLDGDHRLQLGRYFTRRISRLEPPFILCLLIYWLIWRHPLMDYAGNLGASLIHAHGPIYGSDSAINHVVWSLEVEVQFYIIAPFLGFIFMVRSKQLRRAILLGSVAGLIWVDMNRWLLSPWMSHFMYSATLAGKLVYFLPGLLLADMYVVDWKNAPSTSSLWDLLGLVGWCGIPAALYLPGDWKWFVLLLQWFGFVGAFRGRLLSRVFAFPLLTVIGGMCYTIYLYHPRIIHTTGAAVTAFVPETAENFLIRFILISAISVIFILLISTVLFVLVEKPCMRKDWPSKLIARLGWGSSRRR